MWWPVLKLENVKRPIFGECCEMFSIMFKGRSAHVPWVFEHERVSRRLYQKFLVFSPYQSFVRISSGFWHISETEIILVFLILKWRNKKNMFWFLRRTGAASFLSSFNNNNNTNGASKVASFSEKNNSGCHDLIKIRLYLSPLLCCVKMNEMTNQ